MKLRKANISEVTTIWEILQQAIEQRREDGSEQWQNGYPNPQTVFDDITAGYGYVVTDDDLVIAYAAIIFGVEPAYNGIVGQWLTNGDYVVVHRIATSNSVKRQGVATKLLQLIEDLAIGHNVFSIRVDTNFDNIPMLKIVERLGYSYCGEVFYEGAPRKAFEKMLRSGSDSDGLNG